MSRRRRGSAGAVLAALLFLGCAETPPAEHEAEGVAGTSSAATSPAADIDLKAVDRAGYDAALTKRRGQVVLVDFWATWCGPCVEQLPHTTALAKARRGDGLAVITMCMEDADATAAIKARLAAAGATATINLLSSEGGGSAAMEAFEIAGGALPHYKIYDREGKLRAEFGLDPGAAKQFTVDDVEAAVTGALAE